MSTRINDRVVGLSPNALTSETVSSTHKSTAIPLEYITGVGIVVKATVGASTAGTADTGEEEVTRFTFPNFATIASGDYIVVYDTAGLAWAVAADKTGAAAEPTGAIWTAIPAGRKAQVDLSVGVTTNVEVAAAFEVALDALTSFPFDTNDTAADGTMLVTANLRGICTNSTVKNADDSGAGTITATTTVAGEDSKVSAGDDTINFGSVDWETGRKGQLSISSGSLPTGLAAATDYYLIKISTGVFRFATSLVNALAGVTYQNISTQGSDSEVITFTPSALAGANVKAQVAVEDVDASYVDWDSAQNITATANFKINVADCNYRFLRVVTTLTAGQIALETQYCLKG